VPKKAAQVQTFVNDTRSGFSAMGALNLLPPVPVAKPVVAKTAPIIARPPRVRNPKDDISELDFDGAPNAAPPATDHVH
jgi:hypothetical protein